MAEQSAIGLTSWPIVESELIRTAFARAIADDSAGSKMAIDETLFSGGVESQAAWQSLWAAQYRDAVAAIDELQIYDRTLMTPVSDLHSELLTKGLDVSGILPIVLEREEEFGGLVNTAMAATTRLFVMRLPSFAALKMAAELANSIDMKIGKEDAQIVDGVLSGVANLVSSVADHAINTAFAGLKREMVDYQQRGPNMPEAEELASDFRVDGYEDILHSHEAQTLTGVIAKLRNAFQHIVGSNWSDLAMADVSEARFAEGLKGADASHKLLWSSIEDLARIAGVSLVEQGV